MINKIITEKCKTNTSGKSQKGTIWPDEVSIFGKIHNHSNNSVGVNFHHVTSQKGIYTGGFWSELENQRLESLKTDKTSI